MPQFYTLLTDTGQAKLANAVALGGTIEITELAVGDAGGSLPTPDSSATALINEVRRAPINTSTTDPDNPSWIVVEQVLPPDVGGWTIREIGIFDVDGDLIGVGNYPETYKPVLAEGSSRTQTVRFVLEVSDTAAVTLKVDPSVVLATREYVDDRSDRVIPKDTVADMVASNLPAGLQVRTSGKDAPGDGGGHVYLIQDVVGTPADGVKIVALDNGNYAVRDKPLYIAKAPAGAGFAPGEWKFLFMDPEEYAQHNSGEALDVGNQFHYFASGDDVRVEFEANPGHMQFYLEGGIGKEVWYGLQEQSTHAWSFGMNTAQDRALRFCTGFGIGSKNPALMLKENGEAVLRGFRASEQSFIEMNAGLGIAPLILRNSATDGNGLLVKVGIGSGLYLADFRDAATEQSLHRILKDGTPEWGSVAKTANGYAPLGNGLILQWGETSIGLNEIKTVTFPVTFPTACLQFSCGTAAEASDRNSVALERSDMRSANGTSIWLDGIGSSVSSIKATWFAIGY